MDKFAIKKKEARLALNAHVSRGKGLNVLRSVGEGKRSEKKRFNPGESVSSPSLLGKEGTLGSQRQASRGRTIPEGFQRTKIRWGGLERGGEDISLKKKRVWESKIETALTNRTGK